MIYGQTHDAFQVLNIVVSDEDDQISSDLYISGAVCGSLMMRDDKGSLTLPETWCISSTSLLHPHISLPHLYDPVQLQRH